MGATPAPRRSMLVFALLLMTSWTFGGWVVFMTLGCEFGGGGSGLGAGKEHHHGNLRYSTTGQTDGEAQPDNQPLLSSEELLAKNEATLQGGGIDERAQVVVLRARVSKLEHELEVLRRSAEETLPPAAEPGNAGSSGLKTTRASTQVSTTQVSVVVESDAEASTSKPSPAEPKRVERAREIVELLDLASLVDVRRGTDNGNWKSNSRGNALPLIARPMGMTHWSITNKNKLVKNKVDQWFFGSSSTKFGGIRCTHQPSPWIGDYGFFDLMPMVKPFVEEATYDNLKAKLHPSHMELEVTSQCAGQQCTKVRVASTRRGGVIEMTFPASAQMNGVHFAHLSKFTGTQDPLGNRMLFEGQTKATSVFEAPPHMVNFVVGSLEFHPPVKGTQINTGVHNAVTWMPPDAHSPVTVTIRMGTSFISTKQAHVTLEREASEAVVGSFDTVVSQGSLEWNKLLNRVTVELDDEQTQNRVEQAELRTMLYSALYRALLFPRQLGEVDENGVLVHYSPYSATGGKFRGPLSTDSGFWDAYRAVYPFLHLFFPDVAGPVMEGWVNAIREDTDNMLTQWASPGRVASMVGSMGEVSMAEAIVNEALAPDSARVAYDYLKRSALQEIKTGREYLGEYKKSGYVPVKRKRDATVGLSLNYYVADYAVSRAARHVGDHETAAVLEARSGNWRKLFDPSSKFFRPRDASGTFQTPFKEFEWMGAYTEGGPWQYRFYVPHDPAGLRKAYQNGAPVEESKPTAMCEALAAMMTGSNQVTNRWKIHEMTEMQKHSFGQYAHNNQPVHHVLYMFAHAGCPLEGQKWIHHTLRTQYGEFGFAGDEDNGEMSSWYLLSSLGLYALMPSSGQYQLGAPPLFKSVTIQRESRLGWGPLRVERRGLTSIPFEPAARATWNGKVLDLASGAQVVSYAELLRGGTLVFEK